MSDKFTLAKKTIYSKPIGIIILGAGYSTLFDNFGPKCLLKIKDEYLINRQIKILSKIFHCPDFIFVGGYDIDSIKNILPKNIRIGENIEYKQTNIVRSLHVGLDINILDSVLFLPADLFFNYDIFDNFHLDTSSIIFSSKPIKKNEVGLIINGHHVETFSYNLKTKWTQLAYITGQELNILKKLCKNRENDNLMSFEILNSLINNGGNIRAIETESKFFLDIDTIQDYRSVNKFINKENIDEISNH